MTTYEDGTRVIVNISANDWNYNGNIVKASNYIVLGKGELCISSGKITSCR